MQELPDLDGIHRSFYQYTKTGRKRVVHHDVVVVTLQDVAQRVNWIMTHKLRLLKLYMIHCIEYGIVLPTIDCRIVTSMMKVLCEEPKRG